jgi:hypothetical protein
VSQALDDLDIRVLPYTREHALRLWGLPWHHTDPFDRQICAGAGRRHTRYYFRRSLRALPRGPGDLVRLGRVIVGSYGSESSPEAQG